MPTTSSAAIVVANQFGCASALQCPIASCISQLSTALCAVSSEMTAPLLGDGVMHDV